MATLVPHPDDRQAFDRLVKSSENSFQSIYVLAGLDGALRDARPDDTRDWRRDAWHDRDGQPQMTIRYGLQRLLYLSAELRRMRSAVEALGNHGIGDLVEAHLNEESLLDLDSVWNEAHPALRQELMERLGRSRETIQEFRQSLLDINQESRDYPHSDAEREGVIVDRALQAMQEADENYLILTEISHLPNSHVGARAAELARDLRTGWTGMLGNLPANRVEDHVQLCADIDHLLSRRLLAPVVSVRGEHRNSLDAWSAYPWFSYRAQTAGERLRRQYGEAFGHLENFCDQADLSSQVRRSLLALMDQICELWEIGPAALRKHLHAGFGWERAGGLVNMIPGRPGTACHPVLLVVAQGANLDRRLREAIDHCIRCHGTTRLAIVVTDRWDNERFTDHHEPTFLALREAFGLRLGALIRVGEQFVFQRVIE